MSDAPPASAAASSAGLSPASGPQALDPHGSPGPWCHQGWGPLLWGVEVVVLGRVPAVAAVPQTSQHRGGESTSGPQ